MDILYSFVGNHDPLTLPAPGEDPGPVISLLRYQRFDHLVLFVTAPEYSERAVVIQQAAAAAAGRGPAPRCSFVTIRLESVVDYEEIFARLSETIPEVEENLPFSTGQMSRWVLLDPGTPAMQTVWFLMVRSGHFDATLLQGIPARFAGGTYRARMVDPSPAALAGGASDGGGRGAGGRGAPGRDARAETAPRRRESDQDWTVSAPTILGQSADVALLHQRIETVARYDHAVLIHGETGTGKELVARHIHNRSPRSRQAFIAVNCAALGAGTVESELFGHRKGAFTGAQADRNGVFRAADQGTLFLDEIGELPASTQAKLLRVIEYGEVTPVGADRPLQVNTRILAATNRDLEEMVADGSFRADLLERIRQLDIEVPPLRTRAGDVEILATSFVDQWCATHGRLHRLSPDALELLRGHRWPRNVRELQNVITRMCAFSDAMLIDAEAVRLHLTPGEVAPAAGLAAGHASPDHGSPDRAAPDREPEDNGPIGSGPAAGAFEQGPVDLPAVLRDVEERWYAAALHAAGGRRAEAARLLGLKPPAFRKALKERFPHLAGS